jgi:hypothetical protein
MAGAAGALLLQGGFLLLFLASMPRFVAPPVLEREFHILMPRFRPAPPLPAAAGETPGPVRVTPPLLLPPGPALTLPNLPPSALPGLEAFGRALNNCAPEKFNALTPEERTHCPRPGGGMAMRDVPDLGPVLGRAKDEASWQEEWNEKHWMPGLCGPDQGSSVAGCGALWSGSGLQCRGLFDRSVHRGI